MKKEEFGNKHTEFVTLLNNEITDEIGNWTIKGFVDIYQNLYTISYDTKIVSKILETHLLPKIIGFADSIGFNVILPNHQNYYPDFSFVNKKNDKIKFAVDLKTTYRKDNKPTFCNGFTLGSHGQYFINRASSKNIQFPYSSYISHYCLGVIYSRVIESEVKNQIFHIDDLLSIKSVIKDFTFFFQEKWKIASDRSGSGNTANIGSITNIDDILRGNGTFANLGEDIFDEYWANYNKIYVKIDDKKMKKLTRLPEFLKYKNL